MVVVHQKKAVSPLSGHTISVLSFVAASKNRATLFPFQPIKHLCHFLQAGFFTAFLAAGFFKLCFLVALLPADPLWDKLYGGGRECGKLFGRKPSLRSLRFRHPSNPFKGQSHSKSKYTKKKNGRRNQRASASSFFSSATPAMSTALASSKISCMVSFRMHGPNARPAARHWTWQQPRLKSSSFEFSSHSLMKASNASVCA